MSRSWTAASERARPASAALVVEETTHVGFRRHAALAHASGAGRARAAGAAIPHASALALRASPHRHVGHVRVAARPAGTRVALRAWRLRRKVDAHARVRAGVFYAMVPAEPAAIGAAVGHAGRHESAAADRDAGPFAALPFAVVGLPRPLLLAHAAVAGKRRSASRSQSRGRRCFRDARRSDAVNAAVFAPAHRLGTKPCAQGFGRRGAGRLAGGRVPPLGAAAAGEHENQTDGPKARCHQRFST